jgi:enoyl-CoA hydratase/carnithine racemase
MSNDLLYEESDYIAQIRFNRPDKLNAITDSMYADLSRLVQEADKKRTVRVLIISGSGKAFSAGFDLTIASPSGDSEMVRKDFQAANLSRWAIWNCSKPVIAKIHGYCLGGAFHIILTCDFAIASEDAIFGEPEVKSSAPSVFPILPWVVGIKAAKRISFLGEYIKAKDALQLGLVTEVVKRPSLDQTTLDLASKLATIPANTLRTVKDGINKAYELAGLKNAINYAVELAVTHFFSKSQEELEFNKMIRKRGLKEALQWRQDQFKINSF